MRKLEARSREDRPSVARVLVVVTLLLLIPAVGQPSEEQALGLIVKIEGMLQRAENGALVNEKTQGSGIVFAQSDSQVWVVTANHVVRSDNLLHTATSLTVTPSWRGAEPFDALVHRRNDDDNDIAVITVDVTAAELGASFDFGRLRSNGELGRRDDVHPIGYPGGELDLRLEPGAVARVRDNWIRFETDSIAEGSSGGGLFDGDYNLVGMVSRITNSHSEALAIDTVLEYLLSWNLSVDLSRPQLAVCALPESSGRVPRKAFKPYEKALDAIQDDDWEAVAKGMTKAIKIHAEEDGWATHPTHGQPTAYLPYYYLGLAHYEMQDGCEGWTCAWDRSWDEGMAIRTDEGDRLAGYRDECKPPA